MTRLQSSHFLRQSRKHRLERKCIGETRLENDNGEPCDGRVKITQHRKRAVKEETHIVEHLQNPAAPPKLGSKFFVTFFWQKLRTQGQKHQINSAFNFVSTDWGSNCIIFFRFVYHDQPGKRRGFLVHYEEHRLILLSSSTSYTFGYIFHTIAG